MTKQSSIQQLIEEINRRVQIIHSEPQTMARELMIYNLNIGLQKYEEIHKEEIIDANWEASEDSDRAEQYFNKTYESKGSDDHLPDVREMVASVQKLIDKDIFNQAILAMEEMYGSGCDAEIDAYFRGAKWMKEELNKQV